MITSHEPNTWQDLQSAVAGILSDCGFFVEIERLMHLGRGKVKIDVYAEEINRGRRSRIICECKYWRSTIPQQIVHAFRTVAGEIGANAGYIIARSGFQAGAYDAVERTNVRLVTWDEFQLEFESTWLDFHFAPMLTERLDPLLTYVEPFEPAWFGNLSKSDQEAYIALVYRYAPLGALVMLLSTYHQKLNPGQFPKLPLRTSGVFDFDGLSNDVLDALGYAELATIVLEQGKSAIELFRVFRSRAIGECEDHE